MFLYLSHFFKILHLYTYSVIREEFSNKRSADYSQKDGKESSFYDWAIYEEFPVGEFVYRSGDGSRYSMKL